MGLVHSILLEGPSGCGKSKFLYQALKHYGSGIVIAAPTDELDSQFALKDNPSYLLKGFDDEEYNPSVDGPGAPSRGLRDAVEWLRLRYREVREDVTNGKPPRYAVLGLDTVSGFGRLALNASMSAYKRTEPPAAMSPDGATFYTYLRQRQEELLRLARAFRGYGVHFIALSHVTDTEVKDYQSAGVAGSAQRLHMPDLPGSMKNVVSSYFSTVLYGGVVKDMKQNGKLVHYVQWKPDTKRPTKNRFGDLSEAGQVALPHPDEGSGFVLVANLIEAAASRQGA